MNLMISGDSFAADYRVVDPNANGWVNRLAEVYQTRNVAEAGVSEYKILKQLKINNIRTYNKIVVVHTSPYRVHIKDHPLHSTALHRNCDLLYSDLEAAKSKDPIVKAGLDYFKYIFDEDYYNDMYKLMVDEIYRVTSPRPTLHLCFFDTGIIHPSKSFINVSNIFEKYRGNVNHLNDEGNEHIFNLVNSWILSTT